MTGGKGGAAAGADILVPVSPGELIDKITILEIKAERIAEPVKRANVRRELALLRATRDASVTVTPGLAELARELGAVNETLWTIEDDIRERERQGVFDSAFVALARAVYRTNDRRAEIKRRINDLLGAALIEEKSYAPY